jgi:sorbitol-specific phosphotransferase system component IIC
VEKVVKYKLKTYLFLFRDVESVLNLGGKAKIAKFVCMLGARMVVGVILDPILGQFFKMTEPRYW